jgi:hypothetical protein
MGLKHSPGCNCCECFIHQNFGSTLFTQVAGAWTVGDLSASTEDENGILICDVLAPSTFQSASAHVSHAHAQADTHTVGDVTEALLILGYVNSQNFLWVKSRLEYNPSGFHDYQHTRSIGERKGGVDTVIASSVAGISAISFVFGAQYNPNTNQLCGFFGTELTGTPSLLSPGFQGGVASGVIQIANAPFSTPKQTFQQYSFGTPSGTGARLASECRQCAVPS